MIKKIMKINCKQSPVDMENMRGISIKIGNQMTEEDITKRWLKTIKTDIQELQRIKIEAGIQEITWKKKNKGINIEAGIHQAISPKKKNNKLEIAEGGVVDIQEKGIHGIVIKIKDNRKIENIRDMIQ
eukprot:GHVR01080548.1.p2 GENE.GHVR01080548.1~~GHVR01080548.1.p2  ORF type:complete len:128 (+),score=16.67 GHVR01080548.1:2194-2577(+)